MINIVMENLQAILMGAAALTGGIYALTGFKRQTSEDGETKITYTEGRAKRNLAVAGILVALSASLAFVPKGYAGVVYDLDGGIQEQELREGLNFVFPFKQHVTNVNTQVGVYVHNDEKVFQHTADTQEIRVPIAVNYRVKPEAADYVLENVRGNIAVTILEPAVLRALRTAIGQYALEEVAPNQIKINDAILAEIAPQAEANGIEVTYVAINDVIAKGGIIGAIEEEKIAERGKLTAEHNRDIAETNAEAAVLTADGEARAIERVAQAREAEQDRLQMNAKEYVWFLRWNGALPTTLLGDGGEFILDVPNSSDNGS